MPATLDLHQLGHFYGTENYYRHWLGRLYYTDGIEYLNGHGAGWLIDAIASHQNAKLLKGATREMQVWELKVTGDKGVLTCRSGNEEDKPVVTQEIEFTDFPEPGITLWVERGSIDGVNECMILLLPSEH